MNRRESSPFGGKPGFFGWFRGGDWVFVSAKTDAKPALSDRLEFVVPEWVSDLVFGVGDDNFISPPGTTRYEPLREVPDLYLDFMALGEKAWADPSPSIPELAELALEFTRDYGPLENTRRLTLKEIIKEAKTAAWLVKSYLASEGDSEAEEFFWPRTLDIYGPGIDALRATELRPGSADLKRFMASLIENTVQLRLERYKVWAQIRVIFGDPTQHAGYEPTYKPASLMGVIWAQFASLLIRKSVLVRCEFEKCRLLFEAPSPASTLRYCPEKSYPDRRCQIKANDRKKYLKRVATKSKRLNRKAKGGRK